MRIPGYAIHDISELHLSRACDGMGTGGIVMTELRFSAYGVRADSHVNAPEVFVTVTKNEQELSLPRFRLDTHVVHSGRIDFVCYDRMAFADKIKFTENDLALFGVDLVSMKNQRDALEAEIMVVEKGSEVYRRIESQIEMLNSQIRTAEQTQITSADILNITAQKMNLTFGGLTGDTTAKTDITAIPGTSCADWLQSISAVNCGFFYVSNDDRLMFCRFYEDTVPAVGIVDNAYTLPDIGETVTADGFVLYADSGTVYDRSAGAEYIITINGGSLADADTPDKIEALFDGTTETDYTYGSVEKAVISNFPYCNAPCSVQGGDLRINNISAVISSFGILASLSANQATVGEIGEFMGKLARQTEKSLKTGEKLGKYYCMTRYQGGYWQDSKE